MADTGYISPGTMANDTAVGTVAWTNPDNAKASDDHYAYFYVGSGSITTNYLKATNFGFSIPAGATVDGIKVEIEKMAWFVDNDNHASDNIVSIVKADGSIGSTNKANPSQWGDAADTYTEHGGATDKWGETWTPTNINDSDFGVVISVDSDSLDSLGIISYVDHIRIKVYYTVASATNMQINISDTWKDVSAMKINIGDTWKDVTAVKQNIGDVWKTVF